MWYNTKWLCWLKGEMIYENRNIYWKFQKSKIRKHKS
jgi:hypothetical protein